MTAMTVIVKHVSAGGVGVECWHYVASEAEGLARCMDLLPHAAPGDRVELVVGERVVASYETPPRDRRAGMSQGHLELMTGVRLPP